MINKISLNALLVMLILFSGLATAGESNPGLFWKAENNGKTIYLLGSIHLASDDIYPLKEEIEKAFHDSQAIVVEADILAVETDLTMQQQIMAESFYGPDESLRDHLSPEVYQDLISWVRKRNLPEQIFIRQKPAIAMISLSVMEMQSLGFTPNKGIDRHFLKQAQDSKKPILELESVQQQLKILNSLTNPNLYLQQTLDQLAELKTFVPQLIKAWKSGDTAQFHKLVIEDGLNQHPEYLPLYETLFFKRNREMAKKLQQFSNEHTMLFAVIGAGHLVGQKSVVELLQKQGFAVQQI